MVTGRNEVIASGESERTAKDRAYGACSFLCSGTPDSPRLFLAAE
jgi:hypothetical protein